MNRMSFTALGHAVTRVLAITKPLSVLLFALGLSSAVQAAPSERAAKVAPAPFDYTPKDEGWKALSLREKIGLTMLVLADYEGHKQQFGNVENMLKAYPVGGLFLPSWMFGQHTPASDIVPNIQRAVTEYQAASKVPLIISEDFERGVGEVYDGFTWMPAEMSVGATHQPTLAYEFGFTIAKESRALGINWLLHPVADLNINPLSNLIIDRATGDDADKAYPLLTAQIDGMAKQGVIATVKHFPGDGVTMKNQHLLTSSNPMSMNEWHATFGALFQKLINDGAPSIMVGHIRLPAYQKQTLNGVLPPATLSSELMQGLLKKDMQFKGVVMSDALNMGGIGGDYGDPMQTAIETFKAGVDIVLWPSLEYMDEIEKRIDSGEIPMARLDDAVSRIWGVREKFGLLHKQQVAHTTLTSRELRENATTAQRVAERAITLIEDRNNTLPLRPEAKQKIGIISLSYNPMAEKLQPFREHLIKAGFEVGEIIENPNYYAWQGRLKEFEQYQKIIVIFGNRNSTPMGSTMLKGDEAMGLWTVNMLPSQKLIGLSFGNPYYLNYYLDSAAVKINAYSYDPFSQRAAADALMGEQVFHGKSPVELNSPLLR